MSDIEERTWISKLSEAECKEILDHLEESYDNVRGIVNLKLLLRQVCVEKAEDPKYKPVLTSFGARTTSNHRNITIRIDGYTR